MTSQGGYGIRSLPVEERPRERLIKCGANTLSNAELLAIVLGSGTVGRSVLDLAKDLLCHFANLSQLSDSTIEELCTLKGIGPAKAVQLKAAFMLGMKAARQPLPPQYRVDHPSHAYNLVKDELEREKQEVFVVILLDVKGGVIRYERVSLGSLSKTIVHPREVFAPAIRHRAASMVLVHNHPSGDPEASEEDKQVTKRLLEAADILGIPILDHIIVGAQCYLSFRQENLCF